MTSGGRRGKKDMALINGIVVGEVVKRVDIVWGKADECGLG